MIIKNLKSHPYNSTIFRELEGGEFEAFKESIKQHGLQVRIEITSEGVILCGHQRVKALKELYGKDYDLDNSKIWVRKDLESDDKTTTDILQKERVIEDNLLRRHLNIGEKTMIYMERKKIEIIKAKLRQIEAGKKYGINSPKEVPENFPEPVQGDSRDKASEGLGMTGRSLENYEKMEDLANATEKESFLVRGVILPSLKKKYTEEKQKIARDNQKKVNERRKKKLEEEKKKEKVKEQRRIEEGKKQKERERKQKRKELEEKIKREKLEKEEAEQLRKEAEQKAKEEVERLRLEEEERARKEEEAKNNFIIHYQSSEKMKELDETVGLVVTSPPYWRIKEYGGGESKWEYLDYLKLMKRVWKECFRVLKPNSKLCINIGDQYMRTSEHGKFEVIPIHADFIQQCKDIGFDFHGSIIWQKAPSLTSSGGGTFLGSYPYPKKGIFLFDYEYILVFHKCGADEKPTKEIKESSLISQSEWQTYFKTHWNFVGAKQKDHPSQFPEELPRRLIKMFSFKEEWICDPFCGTATTLKVAKELERKGIGYETNKREFEALINNKLYGK